MIIGRVHEIPRLVQPLTELQLLFLRCVDEHPENMTELVHILPLETLESDGNELILKYEHPHHHGLQTLKCLDALRRERQLCDVILTVEGHELFAHRALLSCHSNYFLELFLEDDQEQSLKKQLYYQIDGLEHFALKLIIQFIYQGSFTLTAEMVPKVYSAAYQLRVESIVKACSNYLAEQLNAENCLSIRLMAIDEDLKNRATECIQQQFYQVVQTREFHALPSIKLELIGSRNFNIHLMCDMILNWISQQLRKDNSSLPELCDYMHLLYLNGDRTLHDCADMDAKNIHFSSIIKDYQSYKLTKRNLSTSSNSSVTNEGSLFEASNLQILNSNLPVLPPNNAYVPETKLIHCAPSTDHSYIIIAIVKGKMLSITIHTPISQPNTPDPTEPNPMEKPTDDLHLTPTINGNEKEMTLASLSTPRCGFGLSTIDGKIYAVGGYDRGYCLDTIERFDPNENQWKLLSPLMLSRRGRVSAANVANQLFVCGGSDGQKELNTAEYLDIATMEKWQSIGDLPIPVAHAALCSDGTGIYLIGGCEGDTCKNECYRYDPSTHVWSTLSPMLCERSQAAAVYFEGQLFVFGGYTGNRCLSSCEIYNLSTNQWSIGPSMRENRRGCGAVVYQKKIFVIGGSNGVSSLTSMEVFDPVSNEWILTSNSNQNELNVARVGLGVTVCDEKIYVIGGFDGRNFLKTIEIYDDVHRRWRLTDLSRK